MKDFRNLSKGSVFTVFIVFGILCVLFLIYWDHQSSNAKRANLNLAFIGKIDRVNYDVKGIPYVTIDNKGFYIDAGYHFDHQIQQGDSLIKKKGSNIYMLIKFKSGKILEFVN